MIRKEQLIERLENEFRNYKEVLMDLGTSIKSPIIATDYVHSNLVLDVSPTYVH